MFELADTPLIPGYNAHARSIPERIHFEPQILAESILFFVEVLVSPFLITLFRLLVIGTTFCD